MDAEAVGRKREAWIDALKGFAALTVILGHVVSGYLDAGLFEAQKRILITVFNGIYAFHMPLFFAISGFVFSLAYLNREDMQGKTRIRLQLGNIAVVYLLWSLLLGGLKIVFTDSVSNPVLSTDLLWIPLKAIGLYWYLYVLFLCYLTAMLLLGKQNARRNYVVYAVALILCLCKHMILPLLPECTAFLFLEYGFFFFFGVFLQQNPKILACIAKPAGFLLSGAAGIGMAVFFLSGSDDVRNWGSIRYWGVIMAFALSTSVLGLAKWCADKRISRALAPIGRYSLEIFLIQTYVIAADRTILPMIGVTDFGVSLCISFATAVLVPVLLSVMTKKLHVHSLIFSPVTWFVERKMETRAVRTEDHT